MAAYPARACAHRGDNFCAPENTLPAFKSAIAKGAHQIEFDLRTTSDGQLVVIHDDTVDRTTDGSGAASALALEQIRKLDAGAWKGPEFAGTRIPTFAEVLALVPPDLLVNCQLYLDPQYVPRVIDQIRQFGLLEQCFLAATGAQIEVARGVQPDIMICSLEGQRGPDSDYPDQTIAVGAQFIQLWGWADCLPAVVDRLHGHGVTVNYFGTSEAPMMRQLIESGVDYILTDHLDLMHEVMADYGLPPRQ